MRWEASLIGSAEGVSLRLESALVAPLHAAVVRSGDVYELWDLNTKTGTFVNGAPIVRAVLREGDQIGIGPFRLRFAGEGPSPRRRSASRESSRDGNPRDGNPQQSPAATVIPPLPPRLGAERPGSPPAANREDSSVLANVLDSSPPPTLSPDPTGLRALLEAAREEAPPSRSAASVPPRIGPAVVDRPVAHGPVAHGPVNRKPAAEDSRSCEPPPPAYLLEIERELEQLRGELGSLAGKVDDPTPADWP
jgi:predicted component of type VI protein secretion system